MRKTIRIIADALAELYSIPRGVAGELTQMIHGLADNPTPDNSKPAPGRLGRHELRAVGYVVVYEVSADTITILLIDVE